MSKLIRGTAMAIISFALSHVVQAGGLSEIDTDNAQQLANNLPWPASNRTYAEHALGVQTVSIELAERKKPTSPPLGRVYQFNHFTSQSRVVTVDLTSGNVVSQSTINSVHLPLSESEIQFAIDALRESELLDDMRAEQINRGREAFASLDDLDVKASIYTPNDANHPCHLQRCALLSLFDDTSTVFAIEPIVQLGNSGITTLSNQ